MFKGKTGWRRFAFITVIVACAISLGVVASFVLAPRPRDEVGAILTGAVIFFGMCLAVFFLCLAVWFHFWENRLVRWGGVALLVLLALYQAIGGDVRWYFVTQRTAKIEAQQAERHAIEQAFYLKMRGLLDQPDAGAAIFSDYLEELDQKDLQGDLPRIALEWGIFGYVHAIYTLVFFGDERASEHANKRPPYTRLYCGAFEENFGDLITADDQKERLEYACPK